MTLVSFPVGYLCNLCIERIPAGILMLERLQPSPFSQLRIDPISRKRYVLIAVLNMSAYTLLLSKLDFTAAFPIEAAFSSALIVNSFIDLDHFKVSDKMNGFIFVLGIFSFVWIHDMMVYERLAGFFAAGLPLLVTRIVTRGNIGLGDVKFSAACGLMLGINRAFLALLLSCLLGFIFRAIRGFAHIESRSKPIPFVPFLSLTFLITLLFGNEILNGFLVVR